MDVPGALFCREMDGCGFASMFVPVKQYAKGLPRDCRRGFRFSRFPHKRWRTKGARRQMDETDQFVACEQHTGTPGLASQHVVNMLFKRVFVVAKRYEFVALRIGESGE